MTMASPSSMNSQNAATSDTATTVPGGRDTNSPQQLVTALAPGFRFHPTDEELVLYYLKRKICGKSLRVDIITSVDIYKIDPWELPAMARLQTRDREWYFYSALDRKYLTGPRTNRATIKGYWKATGKDRVIKHNTRVVGIKKIHVFYYGQGPDKKKTNWVIHEYMLSEEETNKCGVGKDRYILCKVFQKSNMGQQVGKQYAPVVEEDWDAEDAILPGEVVGEEATLTEVSEIEQGPPSSETDIVLHTELSTKTNL